MEKADEAMAASLTRVGLGVGACIAATEVQRYTVLWQVGIGPVEDRYAWLLVFIAVGFALLAACSRDDRGLYRRVPLYATVAAASAAGVVVRSVLTFGDGLSGDVARVLIGLAMETPYFLMAFWASLLMRLPARFAMKAVALGIVFAGTVQILVSLLAGGVVAYAIAALLAPVAAILLRSSAGELRAERACPPGAVVPSDGICPSDAGASARPRGSATALVLTAALIVTASIVVYIIHAQWTAIQDGGPASLLVQVCTGAGMLTAGGVLYLASGRLGAHDLFDFCFMLVPPVAVAGLYLAMVTDGTMLAASVIPLNIVYATLLFFVWTVPFTCSFDMRPESLSLLAFFLKRAGVLVCPMVMGVCDVLGVGLSGLVFGSIVALVVFDVAHYLVAHGEQGVPVENGPAGEDPGARAPRSGPDAHVAACARVAEKHALTPRESEVLALLGRGRTARHIGRELGMSDATVKTHISHIYRKLGVNSQQELLDVVEKDCG